MKFTEGAFRDWGYEVAADEFGDARSLNRPFGDGADPTGKLLINDRIADAMFQQVLLRPDEYDLLVTPNLNGDYLSDACVAQVGGLGMAPGANVGDDVALFEATHGTAPKYSDQDKVNPGVVDPFGGHDVGAHGLGRGRRVHAAGHGGCGGRQDGDHDLERQMDGARILKTSEFGRAVIEHM